MAFVLTFHVYEVSEFGPPQYQKILSYLVGMFSMSSISASFVAHKTIRLAVGAWMAGLSRFCLLHAGEHGPRSH